MIAVSSSSGIAIALAILGVGFLAIATWMLLVTLDQKQAIQHSAQEAYATISVGLERYASGDDRTIDGRTARMRELARLLNDERLEDRDLHDEEGLSQLLKRFTFAQELLNGERDTQDRLQPATHAALNLSMDEMTFIGADGQVQIGSLVNYEVAFRDLETAVERLRNPFFGPKTS